MKLINYILLDELTGKAQIAERKRKNLNFHFGDSDLLQRMLNAFEPGTYVRPHKHENPAKREVFLILRGRLLMLFFDDGGNVTRHAILSSDSGNLGVEISPGEWHMAISLEEGTIVYEVKDGPYDPASDKEFAPWAPEENASGAEAYLNCLINENLPDL